MHKLKTGLYADKFATFGCLGKGFITHSFANDPSYTLYNWLNPSRLAGF